MAKLKTKSWLQMTEVVVEEIAEKIPVVGEFVSFVLELFWPEKSEEQNIWEAVKDQTTELIDSKVRERAYNDRLDAIRDVHEKMSDFTNAIAGSSLKGAYLTNTIGALEGLRNSMVGDKQEYEFIPLVTITAQLELLVRRVMYEKGLEYYPNIPANPEKDEQDRQLWENQLKDCYKEYKTYFERALDKWWTWRGEQIKIKVSTGKYREPLLTVHDAVAGSDSDFTYLYEYGTLTHKEAMAHFEELGNSITQRLRTEAHGAMAAAINSSFYLHRFLVNPKDKEKAILPTLSICPAFDQFTIGPVSDATVNASTTAFKGYGAVDYERFGDPGGVVIGASGRFGDWIDCFQMQYEGHLGKLIGSANSGEFSFQTPSYDRRITGLKLAFGDNRLRAFTFIFDDDSQSDWMGNKAYFDEEKAHVINAPFGYLFSGAIYRPAEMSSIGSGTGLEAIALWFQHRSTVNA
ncbi:MAG: hypothetical protein AAFN81_06325 [Bacteroidota bacterium]